MPIKQVSTLTPSQGSGLDQLMALFSSMGIPGGQAAIQYYLNLLQGGPEATAAFEAPYLRQFNEEIVPGVAERFTGAGAQRSSAFGQQMGAQAAGLQEKLAQLRSGLQMQGAQGLMSGLQGLGQLGLGTRAFENVYQPRTPSFFQQLMGGLGGLGSTGLSAFGIPYLGGLGMKAGGILS